MIDEEHDNSYKQEDGVTYHARDMAVLRASLSGIPAILTSATPSLESWVNSVNGRYQRLELPGSYGTAGLPNIHFIDIRKHPPPKNHWLAPPLVTAMQETIAKGEQSMLFLNRRGYAPLLLCRHCGFRLHCPDCSAWLVEHRQRAILQCHHCGFTRPLPQSCPECEQENTLAACGPGIERVMEEVKKLFPHAQSRALTSDIPPEQSQNIISDMEKGAIDILLGTQLIAKGFHFPNLTLVGVIDADMGLRGGDLRACEHSFQLLHQIAGRAGREAKKGQAFIQTSDTENPAIKALGRQDIQEYIEWESSERQRGGWPPFGRLAAIIISDINLVRLEEYARELRLAAPTEAKIKILGPAPAPLQRHKRRYRMRFLIRSPKNFAIQNYLHSWLAILPKPAAINMKIDIDPHHFL